VADWIAQSRPFEEEAIGICARYLVSAHADVVAAVPIKLSREIMPQMGRGAGEEAERDLKLALLITTTDEEEILVPIHLNLVSSHPPGLCQWKEREVDFSTLKKLRCVWYQLGLVMLGIHGTYSSFETSSRTHQ
jgi:hypothetical protein